MPAKGYPMAKDVEQPVNENQVVGYDESQFEWETAHVEAGQQITFDTIGDTLIAEYLGQETVEFVDSHGETQQFVQLKFQVPGMDGPAYVNAGYDLAKAYEKIPNNSITRTQLRKLVDVDQASPMKSYRVDVAKPRENRTTA